MPRIPSGAPSGLASTTYAEPLALEANHLNPFSRQASPSGVAVASSAARSEPPVRSVSICDASPAISPAAKSVRTCSLTSSGANSSTRRITMSPPVPRAHIIPISAWSSR